MTKNINITWNKTFIIVVALIIVGLLYLLQPILLPFAVGAVLAYLSDPLVNHLMSLRLPRTLAVVIVFFVLFVATILLLLLLVPLIQKQVVAFIEILPRTINWLQTQLLPGVMKQLSNHAPISESAIKNLFAENLLQAGSAIGWIFQMTLKSSKTLFEGLINLLLIPVVTFYLLRDWNLVIANILKLIPKKIKPIVVQLTVECDAVLSAFLRGQFLVMLALSAIYSIGLTLAGLQVSLLIGIISGFMSIVPYLGVIIGVCLASLAAFVQFGTIKSVAWVLFVFIIGHLIESLFLTPNLIGDRIGLHPVAVIFAILAGGTLFGFFGVLLALPVASVIMVLLRHLNLILLRENH